MVLDEGRHHDKRDTEAEEASGDITTYIYDYGDTFVDQEGGRHSDYANIRLGLQSLDHLQLGLVRIELIYNSSHDWRHHGYSLTST